MVYLANYEKGVLDFDCLAQEVVPMPDLRTDHPSKRKHGSSDSSGGESEKGEEREREREGGGE